MSRPQNSASIFNAATSSSTTNSSSAIPSSSSSRAKALREKFALTRKSLSEHWGEHDGGGGGGGGGGFSPYELPSPTIAGTCSSNLLIFGGGNTASVSPLALYTTNDRTKSSLFGKPPPTTPPQKGRFWTKKQSQQHHQQIRKINSKEGSNSETSTGASSTAKPFGIGISEKKKDLLESCRLWKSFEWGDPTTQWSHPLWTPFQSDQDLDNKVSSPPPPPFNKSRQQQPPSRLDLFQFQNSVANTTTICENCQLRQQLVRRSKGTNTSFKKGLESQPSQPASNSTSSTVLEQGGTKKPQPKGHLSSFEHEKTTKQSRSVEEEANARSKASTLPTLDSKHLGALKTAEKKRRFFAKKQNNSAPDRYTSSTSEGEYHTVPSTPAGFTQNVIDTTRRLCGHCKEPVTNCLDGVLRATRKGETSTITPPSVEVWESEIRTARCGDVAVTHVSELDYPDADPPCHFCCEQASTAIHDESRLQIVSGGLVRSRDGSTRSGSAPYINLPSPNVQNEVGQAPPFGSLADLSSPSMSISQSLLSPAGAHGLPCPHRLSGASIGSIGAPPSSRAGSRGGSIQSSVAGGTQQATSTATEEAAPVAPPASALTTRRPALVPPKLIPDNEYDVAEAEREVKFASGRFSDDLASPRNRRSSIVVIPPMQICPGDLLVYGKVLSQRKSLLGTPIESPSPIPTIFDTENTQTRKQKVTWSLLKLFERGSRAKAGPTGTLEEIMNLIQPCDFSDPKLSRFKGMVWSDFVAHVTNQKTKKSGSVVSSGSSSGPSTSSSINDFKNQMDPPPHLHLHNIPGLTTSSTNTSTSAGEALKVSIHPGQGAMAAVMSSPTKVINPPPNKPLVRKRMGLMRTMSDRCLERRITPALFRTQGFLQQEKLVEGKETETPKGEGAGTPTTPTALTSPHATTIPSALHPEPSSGGGSGSGQVTSTSVRKSIGGAEDEQSPEHRIKLKQSEALWDLFQSECSFLYDHLMVLKNVFMEPLKRIQVEGFAMYAEPELLFGNLDELCAVTYAFCKEFIYLLLTLTEFSGQLPTTQVLAKLFEPSSKARAMSQAYHRYALNYINALNYLETLRKYVEFCDFEKLCMKDPRCKKLQLTDLLVSPVQHLMKIPLILKDIQSRTNEPQEKDLISQILEIQENSIRELDDKMRWLKNFERLLEIQRNIVWPSILEMEPKTWVPDFLRAALSRQPCDSIVVSPRRQIIHEGLLQQWDTGKPSECYVILFDDMLLITRRKKGLSKKKSSLTENWQSACGKSGSVGGAEGTNHRYIVYRQPISLDRFFIHDIEESNLAKLDYAFVIVSLNRFQQIIAVHTFQAPSEQVKNTWLLRLKTTQDKWKRTLQTTVFRGVRSSTDSGQSNVASSILGLAHNKSFLQRHNTCESSN